jgi:hypothetical protein
MIDPHSVLDEAKEIIGERGQNYGGIEDNFTNISLIMARSTNRMLSPYDIAMLMVAVKLSRISQSPGKRDSYLDAINYLAFACELIGAE